jgi:hypothetical protein
MTTIGTVSPSPGRWVLLAYRMPREPSTPRIGVWRKLKRLGVAQLLDGLVGLPLDSRNREQLEWLADEILEAAGEASIWLAEPGSLGDERELASALARSIAAQYAGVIKDVRQSIRQPVSRRRRTLARLRRELGRIRRRDYFPPPEREEAHRAVEALADSIEELAA